MSKGQNISKEDEERFAELFNSIDRNKDGRIDISDLSALLKSKNVPNASDQAKVWFISIDYAILYSHLPLQINNIHSILKQSLE